MPYLRIFTNDGRICKVCGSQILYLVSAGQVAIGIGVELIYELTGNQPVRASHLRPGVYR